MRRSLDQHFTKLWLEFTYGGMARRGILDERTRCLVLAGQFLVMEDQQQFEIQIRNALRHAPPREVLEVLLQATVYLGYRKVMRATRVLTKVLRQAGRMKEITATQLSLTSRSEKRSLAAERKTWGVNAQDCPRQDELLRKFGWQGLSTGFRLQPSHQHKSVVQLERVDAHFLKLWLDYIYAGMSTRNILDGKTRILCVIGELFVMGEFIQAENHIRNALTHGATPREVLEVILQSTIYVGMPRFVRVVALLQRILEEEEVSANLRIHSCGCRRQADSDFNRAQVRTRDQPDRHARTAQPQRRASGKGSGACVVQRSVESGGERRCDGELHTARKTAQRTDRQAYAD